MEIGWKLGLAAIGAYGLGAAAAGVGVSKVVDKANDGGHPVRGEALAAGGLFATSSVLSAACLKALSTNTPIGLVVATGLSGMVGATFVGTGVAGAKAGLQAMRDYACPT